MSINAINISNIDDSKLKKNTPMMQVTIGDKILTMPVRPENSYIVDGKNGNIFDIAESSIPPYTPMIQLGIGSSKRCVPVLTGISVEPDAPPVPSDPLTIWAVDEEIKVGINGYGSASRDGLMYRTQGSTWNTVKGNTLPTLKPGEYIEFENKNDLLSTSESDYFQFYIKKINYGSGSAIYSPRANVSGNIQSLLNYRDDVPPYSFFRLFEGCNISVINGLLPSTMLGEYCYAYMFANASHNQTSIYIDLPASTLAKGCYYRMFDNLIAGYFSITVNFKQWDDESTQFWFSGVKVNPSISGGGVIIRDFYKPPELPTEYGVSRIPDNFSVINIDEIVD